MSTEDQLYLEPVYSQHVLELIRVGHEYCLLIEKSDQHSADELIAFVHKIFPMLYLKGLFLPSIEKEPEEAGERFVAQEEWENVFNTIRSVLGEKDRFWAIDPEITGGNEPVRLSLAENMTDIYQDIKDFIMQYQKSSRAAKETAVSECKAWFMDRWGKKITESMDYLHYMIYVLKPGSGYEELF